MALCEAAKGRRMMANEAILETLYRELAAEHVEIIDNSWRHAGHVAMANVHQAEGTHLHITIVSPQFENLSLLDRHRLVHAALREAFAGDLHALELKTLSPAEWKQRVG
jgi:BolA family transcriptional regulator, general stress-responsive regulator